MSLFTRAPDDREDDIEVAEAPSSPEPQAWKEDAGFGLRFGAFMFDFLLTLIVILGGLFLLVEIGGRQAAPSSAPVALALFALTYVVNWWLLPGRTGKTIGKMILGLQIVHTAPRPFGFWSALLRHFAGYPLSAAPFMLGFIWMLWDEKQQGWHDKLSRTRVVKLV